MVQRWLKTLMIFPAFALLFAACQKNNYSDDAPLEPIYTPSLFISSQNQILYALVPETGEKKWESNIHANMIASPVVMDKFLMVASVDSLYKLNINTGAIIRSYAFDQENFVSFTGTPYAQGNMLYVTSNNDTVYALDVSTDQIRWKFGTGASILSAPTLYDGQLIVTTTSKVYALNAGNGTPSWNTNVASAGGATVSAPYIYVCGSTDRTLYALDINTGTIQWQFTPPFNGKPVEIESSPIVYGGNIIYGASDYNIYCIDSVAKQPRWVVTTENRIVSSPYAKDQVVYFGSYDYFMYAVDIIDGSIKWKKKTGAIIKASPLVHQGTVYVGSFDKFVYAFDTSGALRWSKNIDGPIETSPVLYDLNKAFYSSTTGFQ